MSNKRLINLYPKINISKVINQSSKDINSVYLLNQKIGVEYQKSNLGKGKIPFFICCHCGRLRRDMYLKNDEWSCYKCHNLTYYSQQRAKNTYWYWVYRAECIAKKIDPKFKISDFNDFFNHHWLFPLRPKHMKWSKYEEIHFWYGMYMYRAYKMVYDRLAPARAFIEMTKKNAIEIEKQLANQ